MADAQLPKPVAPAEAITQEPSAALDAVAHKEPGFLDHARDAVKPYLDQAQSAAKPYTDKAKPYTDAAYAKGQQLLEKLDSAAGLEPGKAAPAGTTGAAQPRGDIGATASTTTAGLGASAEAAGVPATTQDAAEKAKGMFGQFSNTVTSTFNQITHSIDEKTKTADHPGILSQAQQYAEKGIERIDSYLNSDGNPHRTSGTAVPVQTTTNTVSHAEGAPEDPIGKPQPPV